MGFLCLVRYFCEFSDMDRNWVLKKWYMTYSQRGFAKTASYNFIIKLTK